MAAIDKIVRQSMDENHVKAAIAGVAIDGKTVLLQAWGESMTGVPATPDMHFRNGAIAIAYIGVVLLQAAEKGIVEPRRQAGEMVPRISQGRPDHAGHADERHVGLCRLRQPKILPLYKDPFRQWTPDELIAIGLGQPMVCDPGTCWSYAHTNFVIVGKVLEKATGKALADLIRDGVLEPLSLNGYAERSDRCDLRSRCCMPSTPSAALYEESTYWDPSWTLARGRDHDDQHRRHPDQRRGDRRR